MQFGFNYLKSYPIDQLRGKNEFSYVLTKNTTYSISIEDLNTNSVFVTVYDSQRNKVAESIFKSTCLSTLNFKCNATGIYYLNYNYRSGKVCSVSILSFKR